MAYLLPSLNSERLVIRYLNDADLEDFYAYRKDPEVARYQGFDPFIREEAEAFINSQSSQLFGEPGQWLQQALELRDQKKVIGDCAMRIDPHNTSTAEIGCTISPEFQGQGFAKEALLEVMKFLFEEENVHRIVGIADAENIASLAMLRSVGMRQEAHYIENVWFNNKWGSEYQFAILQREWMKTM